MVQYFTKEGLQKLKEELHELKTKEMKRIVALISEAAAFGDLKENSAYHEARNMKSFLLGRIEQLENAVNEAVVLGKEDSGKIQIGSEVKMLFGNEEQVYHIVAPAEADILHNKISYQSPLGQKLMGKGVNENFDYEINSKKTKIKILVIN